MVWYIVIGLVAALLIFYRVISAKPKSVAYNIGKRINVKPHFIENMICAMGVERGRMFVEHMAKGGGNDIKAGVYTFIVFEISKNDHVKNIERWKSRLRDAGVNPQMDLEQAEIAFSYLRDVGADPAQIPNFISVYNSIG